MGVITIEGREQVAAPDWATGAQLQNMPVLQSRLTPGGKLYHLDGRTGQSRLIEDAEVVQLNDGDDVGVAPEASSGAE